MKLLIAPDKFKGSMSAVAAAEAIGRGWRAVFPADVLHLAPIADGGEGFAEALGKALSGEWIAARAQDPIGREVTARYIWCASQRMAIIEMSEASGLWRLRPEERDPLRANTYGTGQLIRNAVQRGAATILVGLGGSASTDGGIGMAAALGFRTLTTDGEDLDPYPGQLASLTRLLMEEVIDLPEIIGASDVQVPLLGASGAARLFGPQKGADPRTVEALENGLASLADVVSAELDCDFREEPGAGAAGGLGFGLLSFCRGRLRSGFEMVAEFLDLERRVAESDLVITGEGRLDAQTLEGKGPAGVALLARRHGKPVLAFAGSIADDPRVSQLFDATCGIINSPISLEEAMRGGVEFLERAATRTAHLFRLATR